MRISDFGARCEPQSESATAIFREMESQQKLWRWVLVATLMLLLIETWLGGWLTRSSPAAEREP